MLNPRLTKQFFVKRLTKGVFATKELGFGINKQVLNSSIHAYQNEYKALRSYDVIKHSGT